jgi:phosphotransferase system enzyme I (PtsI)
MKSKRFLLTGIPVSPGFARGTATVYDFDVERKLQLPHREIVRNEISVELNRLDEALDQATLDFADQERESKEVGGVDAGGVASAHGALAKEIAALVKQHVGSELVNAEQALESVVFEIVERLQQIDSDYHSAREQDIRDVGRRMMRSLSGIPLWTDSPLPPDSIIVARELLPSEIIELAQSGLVGVVSETGGKFSHTFILARALGIPAITSIVGVTSQISAGTRMLIDGEAGEIICNPTNADEKKFANQQQEFEKLAELTLQHESLPCVTLDGIEISLVANLGLIAEANLLAQHNLSGVGLFRTEMLFLDATESPSFDEQVKSYSKVARLLDGRPLVIRTFDLGGDKTPSFILANTNEPNQYLRLRGLKFSLEENSILETQLRAILQVAQESDVRILFPMVIDADDLAQATAIIDRIVDESSSMSRPKIGAMIETPAAIFAINEIAEISDFLAIGTNDLTQLMLATDRNMADTANDISFMHPAVLNAISEVVNAAEKQNCTVSVCGEAAGEPDFACLLIGLGIRELSVSPHRAALVRNALRNISAHEATKIAQSGLLCRTAKQVKEIVGQLPSTELSPNESSP